MVNIILKTIIVSVVVIVLFLPAAEVVKAECPGSGYLNFSTLVQGHYRPYHRFLGNEEHESTYRDCPSSDYRYYQQKVRSHYEPYYQFKKEREEPAKPGETRPYAREVTSPYGRKATSYGY